MVKTVPCRCVAGEDGVQVMVNLRGFGFGQGKVTVN